MSHKKTTTTYTVQLITYRRLSAKTAALCEALRREAGRCWNDIVQRMSPAAMLAHGLQTPTCA